MRCMPGNGRHRKLSPAHRRSKIVARSGRTTRQTQSICSTDRKHPIVIYFMATSKHTDAPRGMNFQCRVNRLNVGESRSTALGALVCSTALFAHRTDRTSQWIRRRCNRENGAARRPTAKASRNDERRQHPDSNDPGGRDNG